jgi:hypothetical protein
MGRIEDSNDGTFYNLVRRTKQIFFVATADCLTIGLRPRRDDSIYCHASCGGRREVGRGPRTNIRAAPRLAYGSGPCSLELAVLGAHLASMCAASNDAVSVTVVLICLLEVIDSTGKSRNHTGPSHKLIRAPIDGLCAAVHRSRRGRNVLQMRHLYGLPLECDGVLITPILCRSQTW